MPCARQARTRCRFSPECRSHHGGQALLQQAPGLPHACCTARSASVSPQGRRARRSIRQAAAIFFAAGARPRREGNEVTRAGSRLPGTRRQTACTWGNGWAQCRRTQMPKIQVTCQSRTQSEIGSLLDRQSEAIRMKDIDRLMLFHSSGIIYFARRASAPVRRTRCAPGSVPGLVRRLRGPDQHGAP